MKIVLPNTSTEIIDTAVQAKLITSAYGEIIKTVIATLESNNINGGNLILYRTGHSNITLARLHWDRVTVDIYPTKPIAVSLQKIDPNTFRYTVYRPNRETLTLDAFIKRALKHLTVLRTISNSIPVNPPTR